MAKHFTDLVDSVGGLSLADRTIELTGSTSHCPNPTPQAFVEAIRTLIRSLEATSALAQKVETLVRSTHTPSGEGIVELSSLRRRATALSRITETFSDATERYIIAYIASLAGPGTLVQKMLSHFTETLKSITRDIINNTSDDSNVLRETLEMCYGQALHTSGSLHSDNYFIPLGEARLEWPYDPDFESEDYYEHENRLDIDDNYAEAFRVRCERESKKEEQQREEWIRFWAQALTQLIQAGLHDLYPEFADPAAMGSWTKRVGFLRSGWSTEHTTTQLDIQRAVGMARACFKSFNAPDVALLLLSFKNRKLRAPATKVQERQRSLNDYGPDEVQPYMKIAETLESKVRDDLKVLKLLPSDSQLLEEVFECS
ncbi:hypothetical protein N7532_009998 [Penicillium argentinense]|uniref:Uncharacterized protein n=1 Tax=Penicillium argentinense TaxID=1131581 RepID=A0A9W9ENR4_9EURO|nr:uncharacterized protein N7532_009998 [Penicillium argentinense]KAJ5085227.1 hypothetical protein N7532_009998 [Penicillium argentinense]